MARLSLAIEHEISGVHRGLLRGPFGHVRRLFVERDFAGDAVIFDSDVAPHAVAVQVRPDVIVIGRVVAEVTIELTIVGIAGIADVGAPDLFAGLGVAREDGHASRGDDRRENPTLRARLAIEDRVSVGDEKFDSGLAQVAVVAGIERAFGQPYAARGPPEMLDVILPGDLNLGAFDPLVRHQRQVTVRRVAGDDLQEAFILELAEPPYDVAAVL